MHRTYSTPPLVEAVFDIALGADTPWDSTTHGVIYERLRGAYGRREAIRQHMFTGRVTGGEARQTIGVTEGVRIVSDDDKSLVQLLDRRVSIHRLRPHISWDVYREQIGQVVRVLDEDVSPDSYERLGLRYINDIELGRERVDLKDFLFFYPEVDSDHSDGLPRDHGLFRMAVDFPYEDTGDTCRVQLASVLRDPGEPLTVRLDIDCFRPSVGSMSCEAVLEWVELAHSRVGQVFEGCIRDRLRERFGLEGG